jgi:CheY-like chemotaxis protein
MSKDSLEKRPILIVEDSEDFANLMKFVIEDMGFTGVQFPIEEEDIIKWAVEYKPAVILMDLALRKKGGIQFIEDLQANTTTRHIPVIIISQFKGNPVPAGERDQISEEGENRDARDQERHLRSRLEP